MYVILYTCYSYNLFQISSLLHMLIVVKITSNLDTERKPVFIFTSVSGLYH